MDLQAPKPALYSKTLAFLAAGGIGLLCALVRELMSVTPDWTEVGMLISGIALAIGGGAYGRVVAQGPITSIRPHSR